MVVVHFGQKPVALEARCRSVQVARETTTENRQFQPNQRLGYIHITRSSILCGYRSQSQTSMYPDGSLWTGATRAATSQADLFVWDPDSVHY